jgi:hypothetical protein
MSRGHTGGAGGIALLILNLVLDGVGGQSDDPAVLP